MARVSGTGEAVYRGWMLAADRYRAFAAALAARGVVLRTSPAQYRQAHELPGWYGALAEVTPRSVWTVGAERSAFEEASARLGGGPAVLRDYTKSMKHYWDEAMYIPDTADRDIAWAVAARFRELREDDFAGGFVLRRYEELTGPRYGPGGWRGSAGSSARTRTPRTRPRRPMWTCPASCRPSRRWDFPS
ncbi:hypothetical protein Pflav_025690 [Phytohabitans flavus]|uniref:ATP-grasp domain-containing protein n=1 Tax=Phytohabitans flavus TaxID=1076124 RepID=A0A6F8XQU4_9ACTN|nr:hypothetical protein Pflav_025690 [Phytohabitans flavus]